MTKKMGRPTKYSPKLAKQICDSLSSGMSLRKTCIELKVSRAAVFRWLKEEDKKDFKDQYAQSFDDKLEIWADEIIDIADDGTNDYYEDHLGRVKFNMENVHRARLRCDMRRWCLAQLKPKKYGKLLEDPEDLIKKNTDITIRVMRKPE